MKSISSRDNSLYKSLKKLSGSARERRKTGKTLLDGIHLLTAYRRAEGLLESIVVSASALGDQEIAGFLREVPPSHVAVLEDRLFQEISTVETPTGIMAVIAKPTIGNEGTDFCVFLEGIQDPGNLGSILRSAAAAGVGTAYLSDSCADAWSPKVLRAGMGAHFCLAVREHADLMRAVQEFKGQTIATVPKAEQSLYELDLSGPVAFIIGNEGAGISAELLDCASLHVTIPMPGAVESLNAAAAAAICFFERVRQTR